MEVILDVSTSDMTLGEIMAYVERWKSENPGRDAWLDGDRHAIVTED